MKNCKIKRVLVPYAHIDEFNEVDFNILSKIVKKQKFHICLHKSWYVIVSERRFIKSSSSIPLTFLTPSMSCIKLTPEQFLKHYLK